jgi:hypothetical protein
MSASTTSLKLPEDVRAQALAAAQRQGVTPHAFMVEAIRHAAAAARQRAQFIESALAAQREMRASGKGYAADEVHVFLRTRARGAAARKPRAKNWRG